MFVKKVELDVDAHRPEAFPEPLEGEIIFAGRSNVGKSSLLNAVFGKEMARTSSEPGKTRSLLFFKVNDLYYFIDFPGYGYAKTSKVERMKWQSLIDAYFSAKRQINAIVLLIDSRIPDQRSDLEAFDFFKNMGDVLLVLTKTDKLKNAEIEKKIKIVEKDFWGARKILPVSVLRKDGLKDLDGALEEFLKS
jgi:GTP-binding protein